MNFLDKRKIPVLLRKFKYKNPQAFLYIASTIVGLAGGLAAVFLKNLVHWTEELVYSGYTEHYYIWTIFLPAIGILLTVLYIKFFVKNLRIIKILNLVYFNKNPFAGRKIMHYC